MLARNLSVTEPDAGRTGECRLVTPTAPVTASARSACTASPWPRSWWWTDGQGIEEQVVARGVDAEGIAVEGD